MGLPDPPLSPSSNLNTRLSYRDVAEARHIFLMKLPYELVDIILEEAQYWAYMSTEHNSFFSIRASCSPIFNAKYIISISEPIPNRAKIKLVQFRIHSQEYRARILAGCFRRPYHSFTWFEASILRPMGVPQPLPQSAMNLTHSLSACKLQKLGWMEISNLRDQRNRRWQVQANAVGAPSKVHYVTWVPIYGVGDSTFDDECDAETGRGRGCGFIETLRAGDRVALVGRALYAGHENHVFSTKIEFAYQT